MKQFPLQFLLADAPSIHLLVSLLRCLVYAKGYVCAARNVAIGILITTVLPVICFATDQQAGRSSSPVLSNGSHPPIAIIGAAVERLASVEGGALRLTRLSSVDGLSQTRVAHILQDDRGFMWFGTQYGLNRYDGYDFKVFVHDPYDRASLAGSFITALFKDRSGTLWVATNEALDKYDPTTEHFTHYRIDDDASTKISTTVVHIAQDHDGFLWLSSGSGLHRFDPRTGLVVHFRHNAADPTSLPSNDVNWSGEDRHGSLWVGNREGLDEFDRTTGHVLLHIPIPEEIRISCFEDRRGTFWILHASGNGLATFDRSTMTVTPVSFYEHDPLPSAQTGVMDALEDDDGELWFGSPGAGLMRFDRAHRQFVRYRSQGGASSRGAEEQVIALFKDREGNIWSGFHGTGPGYFSKRGQVFQIYKHEPADEETLDIDFVNAIFEDSNRQLWIGNDFGLNRINRVTGKKQLWNLGLGQKPMVISVTEDQSGAIWFGTYTNGMGRFDPISGVVKRYHHDPSDPSSLSNNQVHRIFIDHAGTLWAATDDGLDRLDRAADRFVTYKLDWQSRSSQSYISIAEDSDGMLWLGTHYSGMHRFDPKSGRFKVFLPDPHNIESLRDSAVPSVIVSRSGHIWAATNNGLNEFDPRTEHFKAFDTRNGLAGNQVNCVLEDVAGLLWMSTNRGLSKFNPVNRQFDNYTSSDGLPGNDLTGWSACSQGPDGRMFFGGFPGAVGFLPQDLREVLYAPPIVFTDLQLSGRTIRPGERALLPRSITVTDHITLPHEETAFSVEFSALGYVSPASNRYRYRLKGLDSKWAEVASTQRRAVYTTLPSGTYVLEVQGATSRGPWNVPGASLTIQVLPPWWATWWFRMLCGTTAALILWTAYQLRLRAASRQIMLLMEAGQAERTRISQDLHDTLLQGLLSASLQLAVAKGKILDSGPAKPLIERIHGLIQQLSEETRRAVRGVRSIATHSGDLERAFAEIPKDLAAFGHVEFRLVVDGLTRPVRADIRDQLYRIGREALANAFRHSNAKLIEVAIEYAADALRIVVRDNGSGIDPDVLTDGKTDHWGLSGMRERAERMGAQIEVFSRTGVGTEITILVSGRRAYDSEHWPRINAWMTRLYTRQRDKH